MLLYTRTYNKALTQFSRMPLYPQPLTSNLITPPPHPRRPDWSVDVNYGEPRVTKYGLSPSLKV